MPNAVQKYFLVLTRIRFAQWIGISLVLGILLGFVAPGFATQLKFLTTVFLRAISSMIVPMIFSTLVVGIADHSEDMRSIGRLAVKTLVYFEVITVFALAVGLAAVNLLKPGVGTPLPAASETAQEYATTKMVSGLQMIEHIVPRSFAEAAASNDILQIIFFSVIFALAVTQLEGKTKETMIDLCGSLSKTMFKFIALIMNFAPIAVGASIAAAVGQSGVQVILSLGWLVLTLYLSLLALFGLVFIPVMLFTGIPVRRFLNTMREPALLAFSTASSEAALPMALEKMVAFGVPSHIVYFVLPLGYSFNLDGSTLYLSVASIFVAQAANIHMGVWQQLGLMMTLLLTSKGVAAVPRASLVVLSATLTKFGLPLEGIAVILGVDAIMDMARTTVNVLGNCLASAVVAKWEEPRDRS